MSMPTRGTDSQHTTGSHHSVDPHSTKGDGEGRWSTRRIAIYALFVALAIVASFIEFPIFPAAPYLKYDPSGIVSLIAGFAFGPMAAVLVSILSWIPHMFADPLGSIMAIAVALGLSVPASLLYRRFHSRIGALYGILLGSVCALAIALLGNLVITPLYANISVSQVVAMILPILLPFNLLKLVIHGTVTFIIYKPVSMLVKR
ncbi:MAG: ECF transporter S component [Bifidobacterium sp.]